MKQLSELLKDLSQHEFSGRADIQIQSIAYDSRKVTKDSLFVAVTGLKSDGHSFIQEAIAKGAAAIAAEKKTPFDVSLPFITVNDARIALAELSWSFFNHPEGKLIPIGITGTNGKTTTSTLLRSVLEFCGFSTGLVGTLGVFAEDIAFEIPRTTPESADLAAYFSEMASKHCKYVVMEATSIGIDLKRTHGISFKIAAFTNLTRDHIDYHGSMEAYRDAKIKMFRQLDSKSFAVINLDDPSAENFVQASNGTVITYSLGNKADFTAKNLQLNRDSIAFNLESEYGFQKFQLPLIGKFNASNALCVIASASVLGIELTKISEALNQVKSVRGRAETVKSDAPFTIVIDYAHTPDALEKILTTLNQVEHNRIFTVIGAGGDRDKGKRPQMAKISLDLSNKLFLTSDNPRTENPEDILDDMARGIANNSSYYRNSDRKSAIFEALSQAKPKDVVLIAGKGHETYQEIGKVKYPFDDREIACEWLASNGYSK